MVLASRTSRLPRALFRAAKFRGLHAWPVAGTAAPGTAGAAGCDQRAQAGLAALAGAVLAAGIATASPGRPRGHDGHSACEARSQEEGSLPRLRTDAAKPGVRVALKPMEGEELILAADCGGTTTRLKLVCLDVRTPISEKEHAPGRIVFQFQYPNIIFKSFNSIVQTFLDDAADALGSRFVPTVAVFAVAGIVTANQCRYTNLDWVVCGEEIGDLTGIKRVEIINDFVAQGYGILTLADTEVARLNNVEPRAGAPMMAVGAGTGLGCTYLTVGPTGHYEAFPSEAGHIEFAPRGLGSDELQIELLRHLKIRLAGWNRISIERVVSGRGICNVYEFLAYQYPERVNKLVHQQFMSRPTDASVIATNAWPGSLCEEALKIFASSYGAFCGNVAITLMPFCGLYLTGGVTLKLQDWLQRDGSFMEAFTDKGRVSPLLQSIPVFLVKGEDMGQRGAHLRAVRLLKEYHAGLSPRDIGPTELLTDLVPPRDLDIEGVTSEIARLISEFRRTHESRQKVRPEAR